MAGTVGQLGVVDERRSGERRPISLRVPVSALEAIDRAASSQGRDRTEFMVAAALEAAQEQLDRERVLRLSDEAFDELKRVLDNPPPMPDALVELMRRRPVWETQD